VAHPALFAEPVAYTSAPIGLNLDINRSYGRADHRRISASSTPLLLAPVHSTIAFLRSDLKGAVSITASRDHDQ